MARVTIFPVPDQHGRFLYQAVAGNKKSTGKTAGEALDTITRQLSDTESGTLVIVQSQQADQFFTAEQRQRLQTLMEQWRTARDNGETLPNELQIESVLQN